MNDYINYKVSVAIIIATRTHNTEDCWPVPSVSEKCHHRILYIDNKYKWITNKPNQMWNDNNEEKHTHTRTRTSCTCTVRQSKRRKIYYNDKYKLTKCTTRNTSRFAYCLIVVITLRFDLRVQLNCVGARYCQNAGDSNRLNVCLLPNATISFRK